MALHPEYPHRRAIRLKGYDYATPGAYFLTLCTQNKECRFGEIQGSQVCLNSVGQMVFSWWRELSHKFPAVRSDCVVIMPNHLHAVLVLSNVPVGANLCVRPAALLSPSQIPTLSHVVQWFKTMTTTDYLRRIKLESWPRLTGKLWQRNYYEHIIRHAYALERIRQYIAENPMRWALDVENPQSNLRVRDELLQIINQDRKLNP